MLSLMATSWKTSVSLHRTRGCWPNQTCAAAFSFFDYDVFVKQSSLAQAMLFPVDRASWYTGFQTYIGTQLQAAVVGQTTPAKALKAAANYAVSRSSSRHIGNCPARFRPALRPEDRRAGPGLRGRDVAWKVFSRARKRQSYESREVCSCLRLLGPSLVVVLAVLAYPLGYAFWLSLNDVNTKAQPTRFIWFSNYWSAITSPEFAGLARADAVLCCPRTCRHCRVGLRHRAHLAQRIPRVVRSCVACSCCHGRSPPPLLLCSQDGSSMNS